MWDLFLIWLILAIAVIVVVYLLKCVRRQSFSVVRKIHWPGTIVIALIITALPAFFLYSQSSRVVNVPEGVAERPNISHLSKN